MSESSTLLSPRAPAPQEVLWGYLREERSLLGSVCVYAMASSLLSLAGPLGVQLLVSNVAFGGLAQPLLVLALLVMVALGLAGGARALQLVAVERLQERLFVRIALQFGEKLRGGDVRSIAEAGNGRVAHRFFEIPTLQKAVATWFSDGIVVVMQVVVSTILLATYNVVLLSFSLLLIAVSSFVFFGMGRKGGSTSIKESKAKYHTAAWFADIGDDPLAYKTQWGADGILRHSEDLVIDYVRERRGHFKIVFRQNVALLLIQVLATAALIAVGGFLVLQGSLTLGQLVASELVVTATVAGLAKLGKYLETYYDALAAGDKVSAVGALREEGRGTTPLERRDEGIAVQLKDVTIEGGRGRSPLSELSLDVAAGAFVSVLGHASSGKSTLADALSGALKPKTGFIEVAGIPLTQVAPQAWRESMALCREWGSDHRSVEQVLNSDKDRPLEQQRRALESVGLWDTLHSQPEGLAVLVSSLPRADRIGLSIAHALLYAPGLVVIDGILDDLGARGVELLQLLRRELPRTTILLLTARASLAEVAEQRVFLAAGRFAEAP